ncbi:MAG: glycine cleavage system protein GcvH [Bacteroidota bacterium]
MNFPADLYYTKDHEWLRVDGPSAYIGVTDYAQSELGDVVFVQLPPVGTTLKQRQSFGTIEAVKAVTDIYAPASGPIIEINKNLEKSPESVNKDPYGAGWMLKITLNDPGEMKNLLTVEQYKALIGK